MEFTLKRKSRNDEEHLEPETKRSRIDSSDESEGEIDLNEANRSEFSETTIKRQLEYAIELGDVNLVRKICSGYIKSLYYCFLPNGMSLVVFAIHCLLQSKENRDARKEVLRYLAVDAGLGFDLEGYVHPNAIGMACSYGDLEVVKYLCENFDQDDIDVNQRTNRGSGSDKSLTPIEFAIVNGHTPVVKYFVESLGKRFKIGGFTEKKLSLVQSAIKYGDLEMLEALVGSSPHRVKDKHVQGISPIMRALMLNKGDMAKLLHRNGCVLLHEDCQSKKYPEFAQKYEEAKANLTDEMRQLFSELVKK